MLARLRLTTIAALFSAPEFYQGTAGILPAWKTGQRESWASQIRISVLKTALSETLENSLKADNSNQGRPRGPAPRGAVMKVTQREKLIGLGSGLQDETLLCCHCFLDNLCQLASCLSSCLPETCAYSFLEPL